MPYFEHIWLYSKACFFWSVLSFFSLIDRDDDLMIVLDRFLALSNLHKTSYKNAKKTDCQSNRGA